LWGKFVDEIVESIQGALSWLKAGFLSANSLVCAYGFHAAKRCISRESWQLMFSKFGSNRLVASKISGVWRLQTGPEPNIENIQWGKQQKQDKISV